MSNTLKDMFNNPARYNKFWLALATAILTIMTQHLGADNPLVQDVIVALGALGVVVTPNEPKRTL